MCGGAPLHPLAEAVLGQYEFGVVEITPVRFINNAVFRVRTTSGEYALRIHRPDARTAQQTRSELTYVAALAAGTNLEVPLPLMTRSGDLVAILEAEGKRRHGSVVAWLSGGVRRPGGGAGPKTLFRIGQALGRIHQFSESFAPPSGFDLPTKDLVSIFDPRLVDLLERPVQRRMFDEVRHRVTVLFAQLEQSAATFGVLHDDFILLNCLHHGRNTAVIDFDDCGWGFYLQDLGGLLGNLKDYPGYRALRRPFLEGYETVRPLPSDAEYDLELMIALRHCASALWLLERRRQGAFSADRFRLIMTYRIEAIENSLQLLGG